jgi:hypothetical protein
MRMRLMLGCLLIVVVFGLTESSFGSILLFDNGPPYGGFSPSDFSYSGTAPFGQSGDKFTLSTDAVITDIEWWGVYFPGTPDTIDDCFTLRVFSLVGTSPEREPLISLAVDPARSGPAYVPGAGNVYDYVSSAPDIHLDAGTYVLSIVNDTPGNVPHWHWATSHDLTGYSWVRSTDGDSWSLASDELAFNIRGEAVPEPGSIVLLVIGLSGSFVLFERKRRG